MNSGSCIPFRQETTEAAASAEPDSRMTKMLKLFDLFSEPGQLGRPDFCHIKVVNIRRKEEFGHAGIKDAFYLVLVMGHIPLIDIVEI